ncbi:MAG: hypothetical protein ABIB93_05755 [Chloroflexota bacterium]
MAKQSQNETYPLYEEHLRLGVKIVEFGGWEMPLSFSPGILAEHLATRKSGGLFDISHTGRFRISDADALHKKQGILTGNVAALMPDQYPSRKKPEPIL